MVWRRRVVLGGLLVTAVAGGSALALSLSSGTDGAGTARSAQPSPEAPGVYGAPVTERPEPTAVATDAPAPQPGPDPDAELLVTYAGWVDADRVVEVGGRLPGVVEETGSCTLTLARAGSTVEVTAPAVPDASATSCSVLSVPGDRLSPGTWTASVRYASPTSAGASPEFEVRVP